MFGVLVKIEWSRLCYMIGVVVKIEWSRFCFYVWCVSEDRVVKVLFLCLV